MWILLLVFLMFFPSVQAEEREPDSPLTYPGLKDNPFLSDDDKHTIEPLLLPLDHPMKAPLDDIFYKSHQRIIENKTSLTQAGFTILHDHLISRVILAKHPRLPGYLQKIYLDSETTKNNATEWVLLMKRCRGAANVRQIIQAENLRYFSVPDKWLYLLPVNDNIPKGKSLHPVILIVTDMDIVSDAETEEAWKHKISHQHLDELYCIISRGYGSSGLTRNVPYTKNGKFAFVDTERPKKKPNYKKVKRALTPEMQAYWDKLVRTRGHPKKE